MSLLTKLLSFTIITFGLYACGENSKTADTGADTTNTKDTTTSMIEENNQKMSETENPETENIDALNGEEKRNKAMEQQLLGGWGDKNNVSEFTFSKDNTFRQITPVPVINGTYKVVGDTLIVEGIKTIEGADEETEKVNDKYKIEQIVDKKILKLRVLSGDVIFTLRYGEKPY